MMDRECNYCGADILGNDPHMPGCPNDPEGFDPDDADQREDPWH